MESVKETLWKWSTKAQVYVGSVLDLDKKRKVIQIISSLIMNIHLKGLWNGTLYRGKLKGICIPGLNCYSCPVAVSSCPLGALQSTLSQLKRGWNWYVIGMITFVSTLFGRIICGFICPFGLLQELLHKIPSPKFKHIPRKVTYIKYGVLITFVFLIPIAVMLTRGMGFPAFCKYICPQGTIAGILLSVTNDNIRSMMHGIFKIKVLILMVIAGSSIFIYRPFCRIICPLGVIYGVFNSISFVQIHYHEEKCSHCNQCSLSCPMEIDVVKQCNSTECIRCGKCIDVCKHDALHIKIKG